MRLAQGKIFLDDYSNWRTDGHSITIFDPVGAALVMPVDVLKELNDKVEERLNGRESEEPHERG